MLRDRILLCEKLEHFAVQNSQTLKGKMLTKHTGNPTPHEDFTDFKIVLNVSSVDCETLSVFEESLFNPRNDNRSPASA
jgi:hypothetical protein